MVWQQYVYFYCFLFLNSFILLIVSEASDLMIGAHPLTKKSDPSPEAKEHIIDIMVKGNVATREQIITYKYICFFFFILY